MAMYDAFPAPCLRIEVYLHLLTNLEQLEKYRKLDQKGATMAEYIWIDGSNGVRSKTKVRDLFCSSTSTTP